MHLNNFGTWYPSNQQGYHIHMTTTSSSNVKSCDEIHPGETVAPHFIYCQESETQELR